MKIRFHSAEPLEASSNWETATGNDPIVQQGIWSSGNTLHWHGGDGRDDQIVTLREITTAIEHARFVSGAELGIVAFGGGVLGALFVVLAMPRLFARTFTMRRWIARAERARMEREAEQKWQR